MILSYESIQVDVVMKERVVSCQTEADKGISSLMGPVIAASGCPHTKADASVNVLVKLDLFAKAIPYHIDSAFEDLRKLFNVVDREVV